MFREFTMTSAVPNPVELRASGDTEFSRGILPLPLRRQSRDPRRMKRLIPLALLATIFAASAARADCAPPADGPPMCLVGTITSPGYAAAFVELPGTPGLETVKLNGQVSDWRMLKIEPRSVVIEQNQQQVTLTLDEAAPADAAPAVQERSESIAAQSMRVRLERKQQRQPS